MSIYAIEQRRPDKLEENLSGQVIVGADVLVRVFAPLHTPRFANLPTISTVADGKGRIYRFRLKWLTAALPFV